MILRYDQDDSSRMIVVTVRDTSTEADFREAIDRQAAEHAWSRALLYDVRNARFGALRTSDIRRLVNRVEMLSRRHGARGRVAFVASADADYGVTRMIEAYADLAGYRVSAFRTMAQATVWLQMAT